MSIFYNPWYTFSRLELLPLITYRVIWRSLKMTSAKNSSAQRLNRFFEGALSSLMNELWSQSLTWLQFKNTSEFMWTAVTLCHLLSLLEQKSLGLAGQCHYITECTYYNKISDIWQRLEMAFHADFTPTVLVISSVPGHFLGLLKWICSLFCLKFLPVILCTLKDETRLDLVATGRVFHTKSNVLFTWELKM